MRGPRVKASSELRGGDGTEQLRELKVQRLPLSLNQKGSRMTEGEGTAPNTSTDLGVPKCGGAGAILETDSSKPGAKGNAPLHPTWKCPDFLGKTTICLLKTLPLHFHVCQGSDNMGKAQCLKWTGISAIACPRRPRATGAQKAKGLTPPNFHAPLAAVRSNACGRKRVLYICGASPTSPAKGKNKEEPLKDLGHLPHPWLHKKRLQASHHQARILHLERRHANLVAHFADCVRRWA